VHDLARKIVALLAERDRSRSHWTSGTGAHPGPIADPAAYRAFLERIGYVVPFVDGAQATTRNVDIEIAQQAGPQLVVPLSNLRYALKRGELLVGGACMTPCTALDALPDTDGAERTAAFNPVRRAPP